jgi:hypothetical protein
MIRGLLVCTTTAVAAVLLAIGGVAAGGAQAASNAGIDAPAPWEESTNVIDSRPEASQPAIGVKFEPEYPLSPVSQQNAVRKAEDYLDYTAFSRSGLINQLVEFEGFSTEEATFAVDHLTVDWNEQAAKKAKDYLDYTAFSRSGLINQLVEFEGFTPAQAQYGVATTGL